VQTPSRCVYFWACSKQTPPHGVLGDYTARTQRCWRLHSVHLGVLQFLGRCGNATLHSGVTGVYRGQKISFKIACFQKTSRPKLQSPELSYVVYNIIFSV